MYILAHALKHIKMAFILSKIKYYILISMNDWKYIKIFHKLLTKTTYNLTFFDRYSDYLSTH